MASNKIKILGLFLSSFAILFITAVFCYFIAVQFTVSSLKKEATQIDYLPEKITKLETKYKSRTGIHFRGESGKLYSCDNGDKTCEAISREPTEYEDERTFVESKDLNKKFSPLRSEPIQLVTRNSRGLVGHKTYTQYALSVDRKVFYWIYSGNEMGDSFPFWHLNNWLPLAIGTFVGLIVGLIISAGVWYRFYPRS